ncbi:molybdopterin-dependent oxidoreductase [Paenibacillus sp. UNC499MF]|uniref:molybdopterin-dependent oxidoreductase n=1 Tax=Paenibacillus sp. UNC499MF TaxID=1502751 RepID=UPI00089F9759|nr:molybdopterin-dependent oxidoreductase [Paenibacillus sp. UNC499MF]SEG77267.1 Oxidoreductase molybdopterin binding domain-containing protein [Paenibacillus sp. UNC499MF]
MERKNNWLSVGFGKKLNRLHAWNAWVTLALALTGIVLSIGWIRGDLGALRVVLKQGHIWLGVFSILLLALYAPLLPKHLGQLRKRRKAGQQGNLAGVLVFTAGWIVSGVILWQFRSLPPVWSNTALFVHDAFTWVGVPYLLYHSVTRSRWVKKRSAERDASASASRLPAEAAGAARQQADAPQPILRADTGAVFRDETRDAGGAAAQPSAWSDSLGRRMTRGTFLKLGAAAVLAAVIGPSFVRWARGNLFGGRGLEEAVRADANRMLPAPVPLADSSPPIGGGAKGDFRIYTVTEIPAFSSDNWAFSVSGMVDKPLRFTWEELQQVERLVQVSDFHCVTGWSVNSVTWEGIRLSELLRRAGVQPGAGFVKFISGDGVYTDCLSLEQASMDEVLVALLMDGKPIPQRLGGPVRLIVPSMYAYKSVKWLQSIELIRDEHIGYWEVRGYEKDAWVPDSRLKRGV